MVHHDVFASCHTFEEGVMYSAACPPVSSCCTLSSIHAFPLMFQRYRAEPGPGACPCLRSELLYELQLRVNPEYPLMRHPVDFVKSKVRTLSSVPTTYVQCHPSYDLPCLKLLFSSFPPRFPHPFDTVDSGYRRRWCCTRRADDMSMRLLLNPSL